MYPTQFVWGPLLHEWILFWYFNEIPFHYVSCPNGRREGGILLQQPHDGWLHTDRANSSRMHNWFLVGFVTDALASYDPIEDGSVVAHIEEFRKFKSYRVTDDWFHIRNSLAVCRKALSFNCWNGAHRNVRKMMNMHHMSVRLSIFPWASWYMHILCLNQKSSMVSVASTILHGCFCMPLSFVVGSFIRPSARPSVCLILWSPHLWWLFYSFCGGCLCPPELRFTHFVFFLISDSICRIFINAEPERSMWTHANITYDAFIVSTSCVCSSACLSVCLLDYLKLANIRRLRRQFAALITSIQAVILSYPPLQKKRRTFSRLLHFIPHFYYHLILSCILMVHVAVVISL